MRKILLFVAAMAIAVSASAQGLAKVSKDAKSKALPVLSKKNPNVKKAPKKAKKERTIVTIPEDATLSLWSAAYSAYSWYGWADNTNVSTKMYTAGDDVYIEDLFHSSY